MAPTGEPVLPRPGQGEIWVIKLPTEPPDKGLRYVIVVSSNAQNHHPRASTAVVVPIGTTLHQNSCLQLTPGQTGSSETPEVCGTRITTVAKKALRLPRSQLRTVTRDTSVTVWTS